MRRGQRGRSFELGGLGSSEEERRGAGRAPTVVAPGGIAGEVGGRGEVAGVGVEISTTGASSSPAILLECAARVGRWAGAAARCRQPGRSASGMSSKMRLGRGSHKRAGLRGERAERQLDFDWSVAQTGTVCLHVRGYALLRRYAHSPWVGRGNTAGGQHERLQCCAHSVIVSVEGPGTSRAIPPRGIPTLPPSRAGAYTHKSPKGLYPYPPHAMGTAAAAASLSGRCRGVHMHRRVASATCLLALAVDRRSIAASVTAGRALCAGAVVLCTALECAVGCESVLLELRSERSW